MANRAKLKEILAILSPDGTEADFKAFDEGVDKLKKGLKEKIQAKTLEDVNGQLSRFKKGLDFEPLFTAIKDIDKNFDERINAVAQALSEEVARFDELSQQERAESGGRIAESSGLVESLRFELQTLKEQKEKETNDIIEALKAIPELRATSDTSFQEIKARLDALEVPEEEIDIVSPINQRIDDVRAELISKIKSNHGDHANRNIAIGGNTSVLSRYTDINLKAGSNTTIVYSYNDQTKYTDVTIAATGGGAGSVTAAGENTQVQFNDASVFGATDGLTFNKNTSVLTASIISASSEVITMSPGNNKTGLLITQADTSNANKGIDITNTTTTNAIRVTQTGSIAASRSVGGALLISNGTTNTGNAAVFYSNVASALGRIVHITADNVSFDKEALFVESDSTSTTTLGVVGATKAQGVIKVTHVGQADGSDANSAGLSIDISVAGTAAQGIFVNATSSTTGALLNMRNAGAEKFVVAANGATTIGNAYTLPITDGSTNHVLTTNGAGVVVFASVAATGGSGITRAVSVISVSSTLAAAANTDYVILANVGIQATLPTAVGNSNLYTIKNTSTSSVLVTTTSAQTIDDSANLTLPVQYTSVDLISNGTNWDIT